MKQVACNEKGEPSEVADLDSEQATREVEGLERELSI